jgi:site-specific recombinase XerD
MSVRLRKRALPSGKVQLFLDIYLNGLRRRKSLALYLTPDRRENKDIMRLAEAIRAKKALELHADESGLDSGQKKHIGVVAFAKSVYESKGTHTEQVYRCAFEHFEEFAGKGITFDRLTPRLCESFKGFLLKTKHLNENSAGAYFARFRTVLNYAVREQIISRNPAAGISIRKPESLPKYLTLEEVQQLSKTECGNRAVKDAFLFSCVTGLRYEDVDSLTWDQIRDGALEFTQKKTSASERMPLASAALVILEKQGDAKKGIRVKREHEPEIVFKLPARQTVDKVLKSWGRRAGLPKSISFHKARHTFATLALSSGVDIYTTSKLLGHKNLATTSIYAKVVDEKKKEAVSKLPDIFA